MKHPFFMTKKKGFHIRSDQGVGGYIILSNPSPSFKKYRTPIHDFGKKYHTVPENFHPFPRSWTITILSFSHHAYTH